MDQGVGATASGSSMQRSGLFGRRGRRQHLTQPRTEPRTEEPTEPPTEPLTEEQFDRRFSAHFARAWTQHLSDLRSDRRPSAAPAPLTDGQAILAGPSNFRRAEVPYGVDLAAAWSWRFLVIVAAGFVIAKAVGFLGLVVMPVVVALFLAALVSPVVALLSKVVPRGVATLLVVIGVIGVIALMLTFATQQVVAGANNLSGQVVDALSQIRDWLQTGPLDISDQQLEDGIQQAQDAVTTGNEEIVSRLTEVSTAVTHIIAGFFIVLFSMYFFLFDGRAIWVWVVRLFPRAARARVDGSGQVAWLSLTAFVRATVLVAATDALGVAIVAAILKVPFVFAIGVLVFLGAFVPMVGAAISGSVAVAVALVAQGPVVALLMLGGVIIVQQIEAHVLQPFLLGRMVRVHPLAVILSVAAGVFLAGIAGALVAVPLAASLNAVAVYLASSPPEDQASDLETLDQDEVEEEFGPLSSSAPEPEPAPDAPDAREAQPVPGGSS